MFWTHELTESPGFLADKVGVAGFEKFGVFLMGLSVGYLVFFLWGFCGF